MSGEHSKGKTEPKKASEVQVDKVLTCFVIMPIADHPDYPPGHFGRVYDHIIKPACIKAGFAPDRADDAQHTHIIMMNILQRILDADIALCDLSCKNPNVMYELGIRQAFDKPVTLIKDDKTTRVFDTGMLSDAEYLSDLRIDNVQMAIDAIATRLQNTYEKKDEQVNSLIQLMKIEPAKPPSPTVISSDTNVLLEAIANLGRRITALEPRKGIAPRNTADVIAYRDIMMSERDRLHEKATVISATVSSLRDELESIKEKSDGLINRSMLEQKTMQLAHHERQLQEIVKEIQFIENKMS